jgi:integrase
MGVSVREKIKGSGDYWIFIRHAGLRVSQYVGEQDVAEDAAVEIRKEIRTGRFDIAALKAARAPAVLTQTLKEFFDDTVSPMWEKSKALKPKTAARYDSSFRTHVLPALGDIPIQKIDSQCVKDFLISLCDKPCSNPFRQEQKCEDAANEDRAPARLLSKDSIRNAHAALRIALGEAVERRLLLVNPANKQGKSYRRAERVRDEVDVFRHEEIPLLLETMLTHFGFENYVVLLTFLHTGMRSGEVAGLQWQDVDFRDRFLMVRRQLKDGQSSKTKTDKMRKVDISDVLLRELQTLKKRRQEEYLAKGKNEIPECVFLGPGQIVWEDGEAVGRKDRLPLDMDNWRNRFYWKACDKAQIRRRRLHDTRHTFASILLMNGESLAYVKDQLGHSSIKMTVDVYGHFIPGANRQAVNKLPSLSTPTALSKTAAD